MNGHTTFAAGFIAHASAHRFSTLERFMLRKFHPQKILLDAIGAMWAVYFLWNHDWVTALSISAFCGLIGVVAVWNLNFQRMSETTLGRLALLHLHPFNITVQTLALVPIVFGIWSHSVEFILAGMTLLLIGHLFGWSRYDAKFVKEMRK